MAIVRCPMCDHDNPAEAKVCLNCGANLVPAEPGAPYPGDAEEGELPDWLKDMRQVDASSGSSVDLSQGGPVDLHGLDAQPAEEIPDWLARIRSRSQEETAAQPDLNASPEQESSAGELDWLKDLQAAPPAPENQVPPTQPQDAEGQDLSWLDHLGEEPEQAQAAPQEERPPESVSSGFGLTGFLANLDRQKEEVPPEQSPQPAAPAEGEGELDWSIFQNEPESEQPAAEANPLDWMGQKEGDTQASSDQADSEELPAWLSGGSQESASFADQPVQQEPEAAGEIPDWLRPTGEDLPAAETQHVASEQAEDLPAWMRGMESEPAVPAQEPPSAAETPAGPAPFQEPSSAQEDEQPALPAWLSGMEQVEQAPEPADLEGTELPPWMVEATSPEPVAANQAVPAAEAEAVEQPAAYDEEAVPDWLRNFNAESGEPGEPGVPPLTEVEPPAALPAAESSQPFVVDLPDWLGEEAGPVTADAGFQAAEPALPAEENLARAELPDWVKDMQPIESVLPGASTPLGMDQHVENAGPLAGLRGVLPIEEAATRLNKLPVYSSKLHVTERQRSQAALLDNVLAQETQSLAVPPPASRASSLVLRILTALVLIGILLLPRLLRLEPLLMPQSSPALAPQEMQDLFDAIESSVTQDSAPVLLAVDYEPGRAGEMNLTAAPVIDHLIARGARIVVLSTVPSGPALAQQLMDSAVLRHTGYEPENQLVNLGFLPGGTISLLEFARQPRLAAPVTLTGEPAWSHPVLNGVNGLQDFGQIIVLTDSPETGRTWVEQVQPYMGEVPLLMVASAQAGPMLAPYIQSGQISGMVSGQLGGLMYSQRSGDEPPSARTDFASYQFGVFLAFVLVLLAGIVSGIRSMISRRSGEEG